MAGVDVRKPVQRSRSVWAGGLQQGASERVGVRLGSLSEAQSLTYQAATTTFLNDVSSSRRRQSTP